MPRTLSMDEFMQAKAQEKPAPRTLSHDEFLQLKNKEAPSEKPHFTEVESGLQGALQAGTLGFADEGEGVLRGGWDAISQGKLSPQEILTAYQTRRDAARLRDKQAQEQNPISYGTGSVVGSIASSAIPGLNVAKGATLAARLGRAGLTGSAMGLGTSEADNVSDMVTDTLKGGVLNAGIQGGLEALSPVAKGVVNRLSNLPEDRAVKAVTGQNISALRKMSNTTLQSAGDIGNAETNIRKIGKDMLDEGVIGALDKVEDIAPKLAAARKKYGGVIGDIGKEVDAKIPGAVDGKKISQELLDYAASIPEVDSNKNLINRILAEAAVFEKKGAMSFEEAHGFKQQFKHKAVDADALISNQDATNKIKSVIGKGQEEATDTAGLLQQYKEAKGKYGSFKKASDAATDRVQKNLTNRFVSPSDYGVGTAMGIGSAIATGGASLPAIALGVAGAGANKFARERGSSLAAVTAAKLRKVLASEGVESFKQQIEPLMAQIRKGDASSILTFQLLKKSYPDLPQILGE